MGETEGQIVEMYTFTSNAEVLSYTEKLIIHYITEAHRDNR